MRLPERDPKEPLRFVLYARKSTDEADRQVLSIEAQRTELREFAAREAVVIVREFEESRTAKEPGRPVFEEMLATVERGEANGILSWHPDRLARNSVDGGRIIYLVDLGKLRALRFPTFWFDPTPQGKFMLSIAFGQSKYYVDNLSENIRRGIRQKLRNGIWPAFAPIGYVNDKVNHTIYQDTVRAPLIRQAFELYASGGAALARVREVVHSLGLVGHSGQPLSISNIQYLLKNPIYYGAIRYKGELYEGKHEPIVTTQLFDRCQEVMRGKRRPKTSALKPYAYRGAFRCGECGCLITTETQKGHNYLRCTKRRGTCSQKYVREEIVREQIIGHLRTVALCSVWAGWCISEIENERQQTAHAERSSAQRWEQEVRDLDAKLNLLLNLVLDGTLTQAEYLPKKQELLNRKIEVQEHLANAARGSDDRFEPVIRFLRAANQAETIALQGDHDAARDLLRIVGSNPTIADRQLTIGIGNPWSIAQIHHAPHRGADGNCTHGENLSKNRWG